MVKNSFLKLCPLLIFIAACDDAPPREKFPGGHGRTTDIQQAEATKAVMGGFDPMNNAFMKRNNEGNAPKGGPVKESESIKGVVKLGKNVKLREGMLLYIAARKPEGGPPAAAKKEFSANFPYEFVMSGNDAIMMGSSSFEGELELTARLDQDGDPLTHQKGDYFGTVKTKVGDQKVEIVIDQEVQGE